MKFKKGSTSLMIIAAILAALVVAMVFTQMKPPASDELEQQSQIKTFASEAEVVNFLNKSRQTGYGSAFGAATTGVVRSDIQTLESGSVGAPSAAPTAAGGDISQKADDYSTTNVQIAGVDEADYVKNDGEYIYKISGNEVVIIDAFPADEMKIVSTINLSNQNPQAIYANGDRLVVFGSVYNYYWGGPIPLEGDVLPVDIGGGIGASSGVSESVETTTLPATETSGKDVPESGSAEPQQATLKPDVERIASPSIWPSPSYSPPTTYIKVYDITDRSNPDLKKNIELNGTYYDSRMIGDHVYAIVNSQPYYYGGGVILPTFAPNQRAFPEVYYFDVPDYSYQFTNVLSLNVLDESSEINSKVFLLGYSSNLFVSENNVYMVYQKRVSQNYMIDRVLDEILLPVMPQKYVDQINEIRSSDGADYEKQREMENVLRAWMEEIGPEEAARLQQLFQDKFLEIQKEIAKEMEKSVIHKIEIKNGNIEYKTKGEVPGYPLNQFSMDEHNGYFRIATTTNAWQGSSLNHIYVLDDGMNTVGKVEDLAEGERIFSARFIGDRAYLVTFVRIDPLFVIDLSDPTQPKVLGELKIPGVSDYLHPYDENHIIGVGRSTEEMGERVTFKGLKLALFDVSDVANPVEVAKYEIGDQGTSSDALYDHKSFLFSREKSLLALPVSLYEKKSPDQYWGENTFNGVFVFSLTAEDGFTLKGRVTHVEPMIIEGKDGPVYDYWTSAIRRSLYMDDVLYTISDSFVKANDLGGLDEISKVKLPNAYDFYPVY